MLCASFLLASSARGQLRPQVTPKPKKPAATKPANPPPETTAEQPKPQQPEAPQAPSTPQPARIIVETSAGAEIYLDDRFVGRASAEGRLVIADTPPGEHSLRISLAGKRDHAEKIKLGSGEERTVKSALADLPATLVIRALPSSRVSVDGGPQAFTDRSGELEIAELSPGTHQVRVAAPGMKEWSSDVTLRPGERRIVSAGARQATGSIALHAPAEAEVFLDGASRGKIDASGKFAVDGLRPGTYKLRLSHKRYQDWEQSVTVAAGASVPVAAEMRPKEVSYALHGTLSGHLQTIRALGFSPDGIWLVSGSQDGSVRLWDVPQATALRPIIPLNPDDPEDVYSLAFSPDGRLLATGQRRLWWRNQIRFWQVGSWGETKVEGIVRTIYSRPSSLAFSHDGRLLAAHIDDDIRVWQMAGGREILKLTAPIKIKVGEYVLGEIAFSADDTLLVSAGRDVILWRMPQGTVAYRIPRQAKSVALSPDKRLLAASGTTHLVLHDIQTGNAVRTLAYPSGVSAVAFSPDGRTLAAGYGDGVVKLWDPSTGKEMQTLLRHAGSVSVLTFSKDGQWLASAAADNLIKLWKLQE